MKTAAHISLSGDRPSRWGGITGNIADQADLNTILDSFADDLNDLTGEVETKASAAAVVQALSTKADLVDGVIPASQLPSFVDDVLVYPTWADFPVTGEAGKIYVTEDTNKTYRWSGSGYVVIADGVALGETATTAYRGDRGKAAYDHTLSQGNPHNATTSDIPEGTRLYFTKDRVLQAALIGLNTTNPAPVTATDALLAAIGKLQAQINNVGSGGSSGVVTWVKADTIGTVHPNIIAANNFIELARINGMLWIRGFFKNTGPIVYESQPHLLKINDIQYKILHRNSISTTMTNITPRNAENNTPTIAFRASGICLDASSAPTSLQYFSVMMVSLPTSSSFYHIPPTCLGELVIK